MLSSARGRLVVAVDCCYSTRTATTFASFFVRLPFVCASCYRRPPGGALSAVYCMRVLLPAAAGRCAVCCLLSAVCCLLSAAAAAAAAAAVVASAAAAAVVASAAAAAVVASAVASAASVAAAIVVDGAVVLVVSEVLLVLWGQYNTTSPRVAYPTQRLARSKLVLTAMYLPRPSGASASAGLRSRLLLITMTCSILHFSLPSLPPFPSLPSLPSFPPLLHFLVFLHFLHFLATYYYSTIIIVPPSFFFLCSFRVRLLTTTVLSSL